MEKGVLSMRNFLRQVAPLFRLPGGGGGFGPPPLLEPTESKGILNERVPQAA